MKKKIQATVISHKQLQTGIYDLRLATDLAIEARAGQFVGVYTRDRSKLLPRPISICEVLYGDDHEPRRGVHGPAAVSDGRSCGGGDIATGLRLVYRVTGPGTGTEDISHLQPGDTVYILGILGNGYDVASITAKYRHPVLMGGGIGIPPMLELARELNVSTHVSAILGYRDSALFLADDISETGADVYIATEDGSVGTRGNVLDVMRSDAPMTYSTPATGLGYDSSSVSAATGPGDCDIILACGPMPMLRAIAAYSREHGIPAYVSLEERMACGVGACLGCITNTRDIDEHSHVRNARICTDGPVFDAATLDW